MKALWHKQKLVFKYISDLLNYDFTHKNHTDDVLKFFGYLSFKNMKEVINKK